MSSKEYKVPVSLRVDIKFVRKIDLQCGRGKKYKDRTEAFLIKAQLGDRLEDLHKQIQDNPELVSQLTKTMEAKRRDEQLIEYLMKLEPSIVDGIFGACQLVRDNRYKVNQIV